MDGQELARVPIEGEYVLGLRVCGLRSTACTAQNSTPAVGSCAVDVV